MDQMRRVVLEDTQASHQQIVIDVALEGSNIKSGVDSYGVWVDRNDELVCPFVMNDKGEVDFGSYAGDDRYYAFDIVGATVSAGQQIGWRNNEYETQMKVVSVS
jgi:hypothetical protein